MTTPSAAMRSPCTARSVSPICTFSSFSGCHWLPRNTVTWRGVSCIISPKLFKLPRLVRSSKNLPSDTNAITITPASK